MRSKTTIGVASAAPRAEREQDLSGHRPAAPTRRRRLRPCCRSAQRRSRPGDARSRSERPASTPLGSPTRPRSPTGLRRPRRGGRSSASAPSAAPTSSTRDAHDRLEVELRTHLARDRREQPLAVERILQARRRSRRPLERDRRLGRERPQRPELLRWRTRAAPGSSRSRARRSPARRRREGRTRRCARRPPPRRLLDQRRVRRVEHRHGRDLERRARDPRGLPRRSKRSSRQ